MKRRKLLTALFLLLAVCALALGIAAVRRAQRLPSSAGVRVPVLMYHAVGDDCWGEESLFVKPEELEKQLQYLSENGYETIFFEDLSRIEQYEKPVLLTFDDGYDDNAETLLPLLQKYGMKATIFLIAGDVGKPHKLTRAQLAELVQSGLALRHFCVMPRRLRIKRILSPIAIALPPNDLLIIYIIQIRLVYVKNTKTKKFNIFSKAT